MYKIIGQQILFLYRTADILDRLKMYSAYPVRSTVETEKTPASREELLITGDEQTLVYSECEKSIAKIFQVAYKLSKNIPDSLLKNRTIQLNVTDDTAPAGDLGSDLLVPPPAVVTMTVYGFRLANKMGYNANLLPMIDTLIEELFVSQVLIKWFAITRQPDLFNTEQANVNTLYVQYNNALTELYKPLIQYFNIYPEYTQEVITFDPETEVIAIVDPGNGDGYVPPTVGNTAEVLYFTSNSLFPLVGTEDIIYVDRTSKLMYSWDTATGAYTLYNSASGTFEQAFFDVSYVIVEHSLGKYMPTVQMIDSDGDEWDIDTEPVSVNITICQWVGNKTGTLYFS